MAADERRAQRLRDLKAEFPDVTWPQLARYAGVSDRSVAQWAATGAISYPNAKKAARFFQERGAGIDDDFVWRGLREATPNLMNVLGSDPPQPDIIEELLREVLSRLDALEQIQGRLERLDDDARKTWTELAAHDMEVMSRLDEVEKTMRGRSQQEPPQ